MPSATLNAIFATALLLLFSEIVLAQPAAPSRAEDERMLPYAKPGQLIDIGGRRVNLQCAGAGGPTVVLMAGLFRALLLMCRNYRFWPGRDCRRSSNIARKWCSFKLAGS